ncbi:MAG: hypothetical protein AAGM46_27305 [Cyanobacteria bacterium J06582_2]
MTDSSGWKSSRVFSAHYLKEIGEVQHSCVAVGAVAIGLGPALPADSHSPPEADDAQRSLDEDDGDA